MPIKGVMLDLDGTLIDHRGIVVSGVAEMIERLQARGLAIQVASNRQRRPAVERLLGLAASAFIYRASVGRNKGSGAFVQTACANLGCQRNELVYLGDSDLDMRETVNSRVAFFRADWAAEPSFRYGIPLRQPLGFPDVLEHFFLKERLWYYQLDARDALQRPVIVRALIDAGRDAGNRPVIDLLKSKGQNPAPRVSGYKLADYLSMSLLASIYLEGLHEYGPVGKPAIWCTYPGHDGSQVGVLQTFSAIVPLLFREEYAPNLINRHMPAIKSATARYQGNPPTIDNQLTTICLNPRWRSKVEGRTVLVIDDFTTHSHSFETARNYLLNGGATEVISVAVGKFPSAYVSLAPKQGVIWDSYAPTALREGQFDMVRHSATVDDAANPMTYSYT